MLRWDEATSVVGVFRQPAGYANGHTVDRQGRLVSCEQGPRRVTRTEHDGSVTVLANNWDGKRLNSPNDIVERAARCGSPIRVTGSTATTRASWPTPRSAPV